MKYEIRLMIIIFVIVLGNSIRNYRIKVNANANTVKIIEAQNKNKEDLKVVMHEIYVVSFKKGWYQAVTTVFEPRNDSINLKVLFQRDSIAFENLIETKPQ